MTSEQPAAEINASQLSYEQAKDQLRAVVQALESGSIPLEDTLALWQKGTLLAARCKEILDQATARVQASESALSEGMVEPTSTELDSGVNVVIVEEQ